MRERVGWVVDRCPESGLNKSNVRVCSCYLPASSQITPRPAPWRHDQDALLASSIWSRQLGCEASRWYRVPWTIRGLGTTIIAHLNSLLPVWIVPKDADGRGPAVMPAVWTEESSDRLLWAAADTSLECRTWYGCYWQHLHTVCANSNSSANSTRVYALWTNLKLPVHLMHNNSRTTTINERVLYWRERYRSTFEDRWGSLALGAALLDVWWRPSEALRSLVDARLKEIFRGGAAEEWSCVAVHVRRGDACITPWRRCPPLEEYLVPARHLARRYGLRRLFIATDEQSVVDELVATGKGTSPLSTGKGTPPLSTGQAREHRAGAMVPEPWVEVLHQRIDRSWLAVERNNSNVSRFDQYDWVEHKLQRRQQDQQQGAPSRANFTPIVDAITDIEAASRCTALVGDLTAGITELIMLRMVARLGQAPPLYSLGGKGFCPLGGSPFRCAPPDHLISPSEVRAREGGKSALAAQTEASRWQACRDSGTCQRLPRGTEAVEDHHADEVKQWQAACEASGAREVG